MKDVKGSVTLTCGCERSLTATIADDADLEVAAEAIRDAAADEAGQYTVWVDVSET